MQEQALHVETDKRERMKEGIKKEENLRDEGKLYLQLSA